MADKFAGDVVKYMLWGSSSASALVGLEVGGYFFGNYLDTRFGTDPLFKAVLMILGILFSILSLILIYLKLGKTDGK
ncbi:MULTISPECIES: AtpZ/AtpI family protein [Dehalobacter]|uniref:Uncharacterized protein n=2 Tax=Dehalobacter restrictus TaxID=55583 RepID=A0A857DP29_9FIRM|nr:MULTISPECIES: AtpZ/AtpI family protein [Dehalobacter]AHF11085.1 ATPase [Dehalobacter restrictus DSM 9455]MCG1024655.1 AtpZ/AtpI family protein [Dehalobacter sp.]MDJ0305231.1 AtpZ/AtpI family protein [Dehalobacter sp.]OCZ53949.1 hypothetical protein A7D23_06525 [Dehalobacter sp. TeCB1]QHA01736.1 hypothetical protein GQ588_14345 [Dehalobacter restrictus]